MRPNINVSSFTSISMLTVVCLSLLFVIISSTKAQDQIVTQKIKIVPIDTIALKQDEMRNTTVMVTTIYGSGSGTIIKKISTGMDDFYEYRVLTNAHVTHPRITKQLIGVDALTGKLKIRTVDTGCNVILFENDTGKWTSHEAQVMAEDIIYDLSILSFCVSKVLSVARIASKEMLVQVRVFDEVFAIGCQLGNRPTPTNGIISQITTGKHGEKEWIIYGTTSQITPGSSGGGLFKKYDDHYYLIGIPYRIAVAGNGQMVPHLAHVIAIETARDFINENTAINP